MTNIEQLFWHSILHAVFNREFSNRPLVRLAVALLYIFLLRYKAEM